MMIQKHGCLLAKLMHSDFQRKHSGYACVDVSFGIGSLQLYVQ